MAVNLEPSTLGKFPDLEIPGKTSGIKLHQLLGRGGWSEVYRAHSGAQELALKVLSTDHLSAVDRERFRREFQLLQQLTHPALVTGYELGEFHGRVYYTMELVRGQSFVDYVSEHPESLVGLVTQLLEVLEYIHSQGIIHRDLKPDNLLVQADGRLRLLDFGVARPVHDLRHMTRTGAVLGTPAYMSPEQIKGDPLDERTDLYSVGVLVHEAVTGHTPFDPSSVERLIYQILYEDPPELGGLAEPELGCLISWLLQKNPVDRPASVSLALRKLRRESPGCIKRPGSRLRFLRAHVGSWWTFMAGLSVGVAGWFFF